MSDAQDAEQFSGLWALAGRPELFDSAYELADLRDQAAQAGVDLATFLMGYCLAAELGSQFPPGKILSRLAVYRKVKGLVEDYQRDPTDLSWIPDRQSKESYLALMNEAVDRIDDLYAATLEEVSGYEPPGGNGATI